MKQKAFIFPGQGSQKPFMGKTFFDSFLEAKEVFEKAEEILSMHIASKIFSSDEDFLSQTKFCQIALFVTSNAILQTIYKQMPEISAKVTAGLSLGEYCALVASKKATFEELLPVIRKRALFMDEASKKHMGGMAAVIGLEEEEIAKTYQVANVNYPGQVVIAGTIQEMAFAITDLKQKGAKKVIPIKVSGAFHSTYMNSAKEKLIPYIENCNIKESDIALIMNVSGKLAEDVEEIKQNLISQVTSKTRWLDCMLEMEKFNVDFIEIGPSQLTAMTKKIKISNSCINIETVKDLEGLYEKI